MKVKSKNSDFRSPEVNCRWHRSARILGGGYFKIFTFFYDGYGQ